MPECCSLLALVLNHALTLSIDPEVGRLAIVDDLHDMYDVVYGEFKMQ